VSEARTVLVLAPHTDDGEFGCGGTIAKLIEDGAMVVYAAFSTCRRSLPAELPPDTLAREVEAATAVLGVHELRIYDYDVRYFSEHRQAILEDLVGLQRRLKPDLIFIPASTDLHQDHQTIHNEAKRAFKHTKTLGYEQPWNNITMTTTLFSRLEERHLALKVKALLEYRSQSRRAYHNETFLRALALTRGIQAGTEFAEAFEVIRWSI
jgi:LmbE family N-acetylglucosaminyl deacetylase